MPCVAALIRKVWDIAWDQWENSNEVLYSTPMAADLSGAVTLNRAISAEFQLMNEDIPLGLGALPRATYIYFFRHPYLGLNAG